MAQVMTIPVSDQPKQTIIQAVREYGKRLFFFIRGRVDTTQDAEDILQDVWYQFSNVINTEPVEQVSAWLFRVARNRIIDQYRKKRSISLEEEMEDEEGMGIGESLLEDPVTPEAAYGRTIFWEQLFAALEELPKEQRQVFIWHELEDLSFQEISERTGEKVNTLISRKRYAVLHLRKQLEQVYKEMNQQ